MICIGISFTLLELVAAKDGAAANAAPRLAHRRVKIAHYIPLNRL
jgi:hypothetical protein